MRIAVLVKQVPATDEVRLDERTGTMVREGVEAELNPLDLYAVEEAVRIKERLGGEVVAISMGPPRAEEAIREALSMGCDRGILLSDRRFAGSDTLATAYALSLALRRFGPFALVFAGERAVDGETGQVGPATAAKLGAPVVTYVRRVVEVSDEAVTVERTTEEGRETVRVPLPALLCVSKGINIPRIPDLGAKRRARNAEIPVVGPEDLGADPRHLGLEGSPTKVVKLFRPTLARGGRVVDGGDPRKAAREILRLLREKGVV